MSARKRPPRHKASRQGRIKALVGPAHEVPLTADDVPAVDAEEVWRDRVAELQGEHADTLAALQALPCSRRSASTARSLAVTLARIENDLAALGATPDGGCVATS